MIGGLYRWRRLSYIIRIYSLQNVHSVRGSYDDHYLLLDTKVKLWDELHRVKAEGGLRYEALAAVNAPKIPEADVLAVPYDWREREPYRHRSLAGASDADLLQFMCGWSVVKPPPTGEVDLGVTASQSSIAVASDSSHRFELGCGGRWTIFFRLSIHVLCQKSIPQVNLNGSGSSLGWMPQGWSGCSS
mgnify:CR=1 FL=1